MANLKTRLQALGRLLRPPGRIVILYEDDEGPMSIPDRPPAPEIGPHDHVVIVRYVDRMIDAPQPEESRADD